MARRHHPKRAQYERFVGLPLRMVESNEFAGLSAIAVKLLIDIFMQYSGSNNGDLAAAERPMKARGWRSKTTKQKAINELLAKGFIEISCPGDFQRRIPTCYAVTWRAVDETKNTILICPTITPSHKWKESRT